MEPSDLDPALFLPISAGFQAILLGRVCYVMVANRFYMPRMLATFATYYRMLLQFQAARTAEEKLVARQIYREHLRMAHLYLSLLCGLLGITVFGVQMQVFFSAAGRWMSANMVWCIVAMFAVAILHVLWPALLTASRLNAVYVLMMVLAVLCLSPLLIPSDQVFMMSISMLGFVRVPAVCIATEPALVALCSLGPFVMVILRVTLEDAPLAGPAITAEVSGFFVTLVTAVSLQVSLSHRSRQNIQHQQVATELSAATSLLGLTCDAVIELDKDLKLVEHSTEFAAILRDEHGSLAGVPFTDFMPTLEESERAAELLRRFDGYPPESINTHAFHTRLIDSCSGKFRLEVFQVMYRTGEGRIHHILGLRDFTDQRSLAGSNAVDAMSDTKMSYALLTPSIFTPGSVLPPVPVVSGLAQKTESSSNAIEHKRLVSLQIDMERMTIPAASKQAFVGRKLTDVFSESGLEVLHKAWADARKEQAQGKVVSFHALEVRLNDSVQDFVDGILEVVVTEAGELSLMMRYLITPKMAASPAMSPGGLTRSSSRSLMPRLPEATAVQELPSFDDHAPEFVNVNF